MSIPGSSVACACLVCGTRVRWFIPHAIDTTRFLAAVVCDVCHTRALCVDQREAETDPDVTRFVE